MRLGAKRGFSLMELMITIAIIAFLSALVFVYSNNSRMKARDSRRKADLKALQTALEIYKKNSLDDSVPIPANWGELEAVLLPELSLMPTDPINNEINHFAYCYFPNSVNKSKYVFAVALEQKSNIFSDLDIANPDVKCVNSNNSLSTGINCADGTGNLISDAPGDAYIYCTGNM